MHDTVTIGTTDYQVVDGRALRGEFAVQYEAILDRILEHSQVWDRPELPSRPWAAGNRQVPSPIISLELIGLQPKVTHVVGVGLDTRGLGIAEHLGVPVAQRLGEELSRRGNGLVHQFQPFSTALEAADQQRAAVGLRQGGVVVRRLKTLMDVPSDGEMWICGEYPRVLPLNPPKTLGSTLSRSLFGPYDLANDRSCLIGVNAVSLACTTLSELEAKFNGNYIVWKRIGPDFKPIRCRIECENQRSVEAYASTRRHVMSILESDSAGDYVAQELVDVRKHRINGRRRRVHERLYFIWNGEKFAFAGGFGFGVCDGAVQVRPDAVLYPISAA